MKKFRVKVTQSIVVEVDESKFTDEFMAEFRESYYPFQSLDDHVKHLGQIYARGVYSGYMDGIFIEGYGVAKEMGIRFTSEDGDEEIEEEIK